MPEPAVLRALEPEQDELLSHLLGVGVGRAITVLGDMSGTSIRARTPQVRFVNLPDDEATVVGNADETPSGVVSHMNGAMSGDAAVLMPAETASYFQSRWDPGAELRSSSHVRAAATRAEIGRIVMNASLEGLRPLLPETRWFSGPVVEMDATRWWREVGRSSVGGIVARLGIEDGAVDVDFDFVLALGPRALDSLLFSSERMIQEVER